MDILLKTVSCLWIMFLISCGYQASEDVTPPNDQDESVIQAVNESAIAVGQGTIALRGGQVIIGDGKTVISDGTVLISAGQITAVGPTAEVSIPAEAEIYDASGMTILPGLIDAHFHLNRLDSLPTLFLQKGVTSVRDPGAWIEDYAPERASGRPLPRLYLTGPHLDMLPPAYPKNSFIVRDQREAAAAVARFAEQGASAIKIYFRCAPEIIAAICKASHEHGLPVTAHLEISDIYQAVSAGLDGIEHITSLGYNLVAPQTAEAYKQAILHDNNARRLGRYAMWQEIDPNGAEAIALGEFLAEAGVYVCPTLDAFEYQSSAAQIDTLRLEGFQNMLRYTKQLHDLGVQIVLGSHSWTRYSAFGWAYHHEMELLEKAGLTPLEIIHASTLRNADFFKLSKQLGSLEPGKIADLVLVNGDPLQGIGQMRQVEKVMLAGKWVE